MLHYWRPVIDQVSERDRTRLDCYAELLEAGVHTRCETGLTRLNHFAVLLVLDCNVSMWVFASWGWGEVVRKI